MLLVTKKGHPAFPKANYFQGHLQTVHRTSGNISKEFDVQVGGRVETESGGPRRSTGGEVKGKQANGMGSQQSCTVSEHGLSSITTADAHTSAASSRPN